MAMLVAGACGTQAAGLGALSVYSGIGQQLNAEVVLSATPAELISMSARLASPEAFKEAGIEYLPVLSDLQIRIEKSATGQPILKLTTQRPVTEPFLHFLVELSWGSGRVIREYTFLLDPPEMLQVAKPASVVSPARVRPSDAAETGAETKTKTKIPSSGEYAVKPGDTLIKIARETRPETVSLDQMLVALFEHNPDAFSGNNMNRLRAGKILRLPQPEDVAQVDPVAARKLVISQASEFAAYRRRLASAVAAAPAPTPAPVPQQQVSGTIKPQVEDKTPPPQPQDKLEVSRSETAKDKPSVAASNLEEELIARDKALREASERIAQLEKNIENLKKLVEMKSQAGAALQQQAEASRDASDAKPSEAAKVPPAAPQAEVAKPSVTEPPASAPAGQPEPASAVPSQTAPQLVKPTTPSTAAKKPVSAPLEEGEPSFVDENPALVYGGGGLVALLLAYLGYSSWRRKKKAAAGKAEPMSAATAAVPAHAEPQLMPSEAATSLEGGEISIQGEFSEGGLLTSEEIVDPVAEAEVLMAYGRDRQAEEVLQAGLAKDPTRPAIHMKLLELYAKQENIAQFETIAGKLHSLVGGRGEDWERVVKLAHALGLSAGIFATGAVAAEVLKPAMPAEKAEPAPAVASIAPEPVQERIAAGEPNVALDKGAAGALEVPSLGLDLDLGSPVEERIAVTGPSLAGTAQPQAGEPEIGLDFDFNLGSPETEQAVIAKVEKAETAVVQPAQLLDFELDISSPPVDAGARTTPSGEPAPHLDIDFDFDLTPEAQAVVEQAAQSLPAEPIAPSPTLAPPAESAPLPDAAKLKFDFDLDLDKVPSNGGAPASPVEPLPELGGSSEAPKQAAEDELPTDKLPFGALAQPKAPAETPPANESVVGPVVEAEAEADFAEAATKLELAEAYEEMGDLDGARELLNEVLNEGSASQQAKAKAKLEQLATS